MSSTADIGVRLLFSFSLPVAGWIFSEGIRLADRRPDRAFLILVGSSIYITLVGCALV